MNKPHEETWTVIPSVVDRDSRFGPWHILSRGNRIATFGDGCSSPAAANLAATAPEMARLLLDLEWTGRADFVGDGGYDRCPACHGICPAHHNMSDARDDVQRGVNIIGHRPDCKLVAALRKAGVLEQVPDVEES